MEVRMITLLLTGAISSPLYWEDVKATTEEPELPTIVYKDITELDLEGAQVDATLIGPQIALTTGWAVRHHESLIELRSNFNPEMAASATQVK